MWVLLGAGHGIHVQGWTGTPNCRPGNATAVAGKRGLRVNVSAVFPSYAHKSHEVRVWSFQGYSPSSDY